uniref:Uncharacterized protein n=1 Tax=Glossina pallidipes TaxID=7398 RepID=A0A1A9Z8C3_GLOPL
MALLDKQRNTVPDNRSKAAEKCAATRIKSFYNLPQIMLVMISVMMLAGLKKVTHKLIQFKLQFAGDYTALIPMGSRSSPRFVSRSASHHYRLSDGIHKVPSTVTLWPCEMTDLSPTGFLHHSNHNKPNQQQQQQHQQQLLQYHSSPRQRQSSQSLSSLGGHRCSSTPSGTNIRPPPVGSGGGRLFSYFGSDHEHERKKSETSFFNLGFRRKSTVVYYAATD